MISVILFFAMAAGVLLLVICSAASNAARTASRKAALEQNLNRQIELSMALDEAKFKVKKSREAIKQIKDATRIWKSKEDKTIQKSKYVAFDIETAKELPDGGDWKQYKPFGITCAATIKTGESARTWCSKGQDGSFLPKMEKKELLELIKYLEEEIEAGSTIVTWNGLGFDFDVLAEESGEYERCRKIALSHADMMFQFYMLRGFPVGLGSVAGACGLGSKSGSGKDAPAMWKDGKNNEILEYVSGDAVLTLKVASYCEKVKRIFWKTKKGTIATQELYGGLIKVEEALKLPQPDNSWMDEPITASKFTSWLYQPINNK